MLQKTLQALADGDTSPPFSPMAEVNGMILAELEQFEAECAKALATCRGLAKRRLVEDKLQLELAHQAELSRLTHSISHKKAGGNAPVNISQPTVASGKAPGEVCGRCSGSCSGHCSGRCSGRCSRALLQALLTGAAPAPLRALLRALLKRCSRALLQELLTSAPNLHVGLIDQGTESTSFPNVLKLASKSDRLEVGLQDDEDVLHKSIESLILLVIECLFTKTP